MADLDERMKKLALNTEEDNNGNTFKERAESYYEKRPQLLALLQDLYNGYIALSDRYIQSLTKQNRHSLNFSQLSSMDNDFCITQEEEDGISILLDSEPDSSLSYQLLSLSQPLNDKTSDLDATITELVIKNIEFDIMLDEFNVMERKCNESSRKIELQKSLLEVLESERLILLNENAKLCCKMSALTEENRELASEFMFLKRKASEMAGCLLKMREDQRVCSISQKIEDLEEKIDGLEKTNKEYCERFVMKNSNKKKTGFERNFKFWFEKQKMKSKRNKVAVKNESVKKRSKAKGYWEKVKSMDLFLCGCKSISLR